MPGKKTQTNEETVTFLNVLGEKEGVKEGLQSQQEGKNGCAGEKRENNKRGLRLGGN